jgi:hypothetical protein
MALLSQSLGSARACSTIIDVLHVSRVECSGAVLDTGWMFDNPELSDMVLSLVRETVVGPQTAGQGAGSALHLTVSGTSAAACFAAAAALMV